MERQQQRDIRAISDAQDDDIVLRDVGMMATCNACDRIVDSDLDLDKRGYCEDCQKEADKDDEKKEMKG